MRNKGLPFFIFLQNLSERECGLGRFYGGRTDSGDTRLLLYWGLRGLFGQGSQYCHLYSECLGLSGLSILFYWMFREELQEQWACADKRGYSDSLLTIGL